MARREKVRVRVGHHGLHGSIARLLAHPDGRLVLLVSDWVPTRERARHALRCLAVLSSEAWRELGELKREGIGA